ncbi:peptide MFS transporter [Coralloluteibacterium stylophorae]|uniref:Peptide MFS transporter n=1 Tax=Coralloluteibacterium stylophorae TaxID=1776034 RepID=A0A8J7VUS5_9GAMM|nr:peptide MFS transporter [Coralloluteibacterium stylophorae]MBS7457892.1 peptide MFS transporter [Coralloluteibacterium stylophorae]
MSPQVPSNSPAPEAAEVSIPGAAQDARQPPSFDTVLGHPKPLWMLFMSEFWERFAFYGMRWALTLYIVAQFFAGDASGEGYAGRTYGAFLALVYATAIFGGYVADRVIGYQRSILVGAVVMAAGLFMITLPSQPLFLLGLAVVIVGNGLFKPNISSMVGQLYAEGDDRRDRGFTLFYMGINGGALIAPILTGWLASQVFGTPMEQNFRSVFVAAGVGMLISLVWFWFGRRQLKGIGEPPPDRAPGKSLLAVIVGTVVAIPIVYVLMAQVGAIGLAWLLGVLFVGVVVVLVGGGMKTDRVGLHRVLAMLILFLFNVLFWMFFEQAGSSFNFLAQNIVDRDLFGPGGFVFPTGWFQSVNPVAIVVLAPIVTLVWAFTSKRGIEPSIPRKFGIGLLGNALGFSVLMYALSSLVDPQAGTIPFWPLVLCYVLQTAGELCLSPIGLSMVTKLAPLRMVGMAMGGWFLSIAIGNNLSGILAGSISGETGMTVESALAGFTFSFWLLVGAGVVLLLIAPLVNRLMHGVK